ncbi:MAG: DUF6056 family protein [Prevotella sp.]|jgi:hypothetical protein|nr:DUF6056 family protein [Prevotella sp.]
MIRRAYLYLEKWDAAIAKRGKLQLLLLLLAMAFFGVIIFALNVKTPFQWDDFRLTQIWPNEDGLKVKCFHDILDSQYNHYYTWGGRTLVHIIAQFLIFIRPMQADVLNTLVYLLYISLIYYHVKGKSKHDLLLFAGVNFLVFFFQPVFGETILWLTGSANYLWGTSFILLFMLPYRLYNGQRQKNKLPKAAGMLLLGIMAGWTNENTAAAMLLMTAAFIWFYYSQKWKIPAWAATGLLGAVAGYLLMILAPGNFFRAELRTDGMTMDLFHLSYRFLTNTELFFQYLGILNLLGFILYLLYRRYTERDASYFRKRFLFVVYFTGAIASVYVMLFSPFFPPRAWFGAVTFNIIAFGLTVKSLNYSLSFLRQIRIGMFLFGAILFAFTCYEAFRDVAYINSVWNERYAQVQKQLDTGETAEFNFVQSRTKFALSDPPFLKKCFRWYYGIEVEVK